MKLQIKISTHGKSNTVWPEILVGNLFWRFGGFESNPPIFQPPKRYSVLLSLFTIIVSTCTIGLQLDAPV